jgi:hypothetical protein
MKILFYLAFLVTISLISCRNKKKGESAPQFSSPSPSSATSEASLYKLRIEKIGELVFRTPDNIVIMSADLINAKPTLASKDTSLFQKMKQFRFIKDNKLLVKNFNYATEPKFEIRNKNGKSIKVEIANAPRSLIDYNFNLTGYGYKIEKKIDETFFMDIRYKVLDVIPGGFPEIILYMQYYYAFAENWELEIYEVKPPR